jgi:sugar phosphate permease
MWVVNFSTMATGNLNFGLFVLPMGDALGMSRSQFGWAVTTRRLSAGISSYVIGRLLDRYGPRVFTVISAVVIGVALLGVSRATDPWHVIALFGIVGVSGLATPQGIVTSVPVAKWFRRKRGRALALSTTGLGIGGVVIVPVTQLLLDHLGWRTTWAVLAIIFMLLAIPVAALFLRRQPEDMGLEVDGEPEAPASASSSQGEVSDAPEAAWTVREALRTSTMWKLILVFGLAGLAQGGASVHRIPYWIEEQGFAPQVVSFSFSADAAGAATMALIAGWMADRLPIRSIAMVSYLGFAIAIWLMLEGRNEFFLFGSTITFGLSVGAGMIVHSYIFAAYFGRAFLGSIRGLVLPIILVSNGIGAPLVGYLHDSTGSYTFSWWLILSLYLVAAVIIATVTPPSPRRSPVQASARV